MVLVYKTNGSIPLRYMEPFYILYTIGGTVENNLPPIVPPTFGGYNHGERSTYSMEAERETTPLLDSRQLQYLEWLVTPSPERIPRTQAEMSRQLQVDPTTLRRWEKKPTFKKEWDNRVNEIQGSPERTQRLLDSLYAKALEGDNRAAQLYLQATNRLVTAPLVSQTTAASELSDEELDKLLASLAEREQSKRLKVV